MWQHCLVGSVPEHSCINMALSGCLTALQRRQHVHVRHHIRLPYGAACLTSAKAFPELHRGARLHVLGCAPNRCIYDNLGARERSEVTLPAIDGSILQGRPDLPFRNVPASSARRQGVTFVG